MNINDNAPESFDTPGDDLDYEWDDDEMSEEDMALMEDANEAVDQIVRSYDFLIENEIDLVRIEALQELRAGFLEDNK